MSSAAANGMESRVKMRTQGQEAEGVRYPTALVGSSVERMLYYDMAWLENVTALIGRDGNGDAIEW